MKYNFKTFMILESDQNEVLVPLEEVFEPKMPDIDVNDIETDENDIPYKISFVTDKKNKVVIYLDYTTHDGLNVSFRVNDKYEDVLSERDADILSGVLAIVEKVVEEHKFDKVKFYGVADNFDAKFEKRREDLIWSEKRILPFFDSLNVEGMKLLESLKDNDEFNTVKEISFTLKRDGHYVREKIQISPRGIIEGILEIVESDEDIKEKLKKLYNYDGMFLELYTLKIYSEFNTIRNLLRELIQPNISPEDLGITKNRRSELYSRLVKRLFGKEWDIDKEDDLITLSRK